MCYQELKANLQKVKFEGAEPWSHWSGKDMKAIKDMFGYRENIQREDNVNDGFTGDRQSNMKGGQKMFAVSQSSANPYRHARVKAFNNTSVPVISLRAIEENFCNSLGQLLTEIKQRCLDSPARWPDAFKGLWRMEPHGNWHGDLPERQVTEGERQWYKSKRDEQSYSMNEWQVLYNGKSVYPFDSKLATDPGAIRIVSVTAQRILDVMDWSYTDEGVPADFNSERDGHGSYYYFKGDAYTGKQTKVVDKQVRGFDPLAADELKDKRNVAAEQFSQALYDRSWIRFYFSFNHYRTIAFNTSAGQLVINPWFAVAEA